MTESIARLNVIRVMLRLQNERRANRLAPL